MAALCTTINYILQILLPLGIEIWNNRCPHAVQHHLQQEDCAPAGVSARAAPSACPAFVAVLFPDEPGRELRRQLPSHPCAHEHRPPRHWQAPAQQFCTLSTERPKAGRILDPCSNVARGFFLFEGFLSDD